MAGILKQFLVTGLHGHRNFSLSLQDNTLVLVGENGSGKTTLLRMLFYFLSGRWSSLIQFPFTSVSALIDDEWFIVSRDEVVKAFRLSDHRILSRFPTPIAERIRDLVARGQVDRISQEVERLSIRYRYPLSLVRELNAYLADELTGEAKPKASEKAIQAKMQQIQTVMNAQILYLPTYRRIERELGSIFEGADADDFRRFRQRQPETGQSYIELVEFGMRDVQAAVERSVVAIKDFARENLLNLTLRYLGDVVNRTYSSVDTDTIAQIPQETVRAVINRIDDNILNKESKDHLFTIVTSRGLTGDTLEHERIIYHYFLTIFRFQESLQTKEKPVSEFCDLCSEYISDKRFVYNSSSFSFSILAKSAEVEDARAIDLSDLSSGEKQIVSLFSHLYLSGRENFFVLIDEPELSLSVPWQRRLLLDVRRGQFCSGIVAVTHSPFIYDNELRSYARSLGEFVIE